MEAALEIELYDKVRGRLSDEGARELVRFIEKKMENGFEEKKDVLATKQDIAALEVKMAQMESRLIKWMFIFLIGQAAAIISVLKLLK